MMTFEKGLRVNSDIIPQELELAIVYIHQTDDLTLFGFQVCGHIYCFTVPVYTVQILKIYCREQFHTHSCDTHC